MRVAVWIGVLFGLALAFPTSDAHAQCPSKYYFRTDAANAIQQFDTKLNSTVCLSVSTRTTEINAKAVVTVEVADVKKLQAVLISQLAAAGGCSFRILGGYDVKDVNISFTGASSSANVQVNVVGKDCLYFTRGWRLTYKAPIKVSASGFALTFAVDANQARVSFTETGKGFPGSATAASQITDTLNGFLSKGLDLGPYISKSQTPLRYVSELNPSVTQVAFVLQSNRLMIKANLSGKLKKQDADRELQQAVDQQFVPMFLKWLGNPSMPTS